MNKRTRIAGLVGAGALLMGMMLASTAIVSADGTINWTGQGTHLDGDNRVLDTVQDCTGDSPTPYLLWVFTPGGKDSITGGTLHLGGSGSGDYAIANDGQWKATTPFFDLNTLTASLDFTGGLGNGDSNLVISHGCPGTTESAPPSAPASEAPSFEQSQADTTDAPSFEQSQGDLTQCPCDTTPGLANTSHPADGAWLLVVALGVLLASVVVLTPARAKGRR